jgi:rhodanese-related sulfurtransferase
MQPVPTVSVHELKAVLTEGLCLIDVREPEEFAEGHVPGARLVPLATVPAEADGLPTDRPVYVICQAGGRSARAVAYLAQRGVDARNVEGGTGDWRAAGYPVES